MEINTGRVKILSPAKINLFLQVTGKRADRYHNLFTLMCCISLYDTVSIEFGANKTSVVCNSPDVPKNDSNLAVIAANIFFKKLGKNENIKILIDKKIPVAAGLGGGSSNAAFILLGLNQYYGCPFSRDELIAMGLSIGADVPFFIFQKPALASGIGEKLEAYQKLDSFEVLVIYPGISVSTSDIYKNLNLGLTKCKKKLKNFCSNKQNFEVDQHLCNDLETVTASRYPDIIEAKKALLYYGARGALMSGSGPTVFGLFSDSDKAQKAYHIISKKNKWELFRADLLNG
ncbi:MAG: 4-(cytidine 5'-diphospho)-2-C-methyl-D-erythritol kinase [Desulfobacteraceae bacterium]|nr:4-(cytidine 5'-diphospho)-2-C-methyl-D-erythritol kinase [Desulfobacteraceae bacterium]MBC2720405.1 4-(cytidine 5'-diphospho)-2-C-methyl-D-erythritol kinase [Desulfobacteraceae bacterium]